MILKNISTFLFDMDGVLFDSMPLHEKSWTLAFETFGIEYPAEEVYLNEGRPGGETIIEVIKRNKNTVPTKKLIDNIYAEKTRIMNQLGQAPVLDGMQEVIEKLSAKNKKLCVVTGSSQATLVDRLNITFNYCFDKNIITGQDILKGKPDPSPYLTALKRTNSIASESVVIENAPLGIISAKAANIYTIAINTGKLSNQILKKAGADLTFNNTTDFSTWINNHL